LRFGANHHTAGTFPVTERPGSPFVDRKVTFSLPTGPERPVRHHCCSRTAPDPKRTVVVSAPHLVHGVVGPAPLRAWWCLPTGHVRLSTRT